ncbi:hypothetical protein GCM10023191_063320 [Actinoallomurus oryzae]|uniref:Uncharacterized protein n=1 Tax=Actinoallomurus oryzae TaxID=502180 RepID=A0ABP8QMB4_9ACTN
MSAKKPRRRKAANTVAPELPDWFVVDAGVDALYADVIGSPDAAEKRSLADDIEAWAVAHDVELNVNWGGRSPHRWAVNDNGDAVIPNPLYRG